MNGLPAATDVLSDTGPRCWTVEACDCRDGLRRLPDNSVNCVVTSPPYWGLRWYSGVPDAIWGGEEKCRHEWRPWSPTQEPAALPRKTGRRASVHPLANEAAGCDVEHHIKSTPLDEHCAVQIAPTEQRSQLICESPAAGRERHTPRLVDMSIAVKQTAQEVPTESVGNSRKRARKRLSRQNTERNEAVAENNTPNRPTVRSVASDGDLATDGRSRRDEVAHETHATPVEAHKIDGASLSYVAVANHQTDEVCEVGAPPIDGTEANGVTSSSRSSPPLGGASPSTEGIGGHTAVPTGSQQFLSAANTAHDDAGITASGRACPPFADATSSDSERLLAGATYKRDRHEQMICHKCGAVKRQLGMEPTPQAYIAHLVEVFEEVRRVLTKDGTCWIVIGDCYANDGKYGGSSAGKQSYLDDASRQRNGREKRRTGLKQKDRVMIPARVALALQDAGWWLRDEVVWQKTNPLPTSVGDRTCPAHEMIYLLTKSAHYHYDRDAIATPIVPASQKRYAQETIQQQTGGAKQDAYESGYTGQRIRSRRPNEIIQELSANRAEKATRRSVWTCCLQPFAGGHFATFPEEIPATCILAGCPEGGVVCDPFSGSGTTGLVARKLGRRFIGFEASAQYAEMAVTRIRNRGENGNGVKPLAGQSELF